MMCSLLLKASSCARTLVHLVREYLQLGAGSYGTHLRFTPALQRIVLIGSVGVLFATAYL
jgi:hypothetical protein